ncbi:MAG: gamma-glutamyl-phosphate reductase, partial [Bacteroidales bacterium]|nr:gamma-glutamyl-phosphate reductase [Bacteroidales bacterium]
MNLYADLQAVQQASIALNSIDDDLIAQLLLSLADSIEKHSHFLLIENGKDLARMSPDNPKYDRLQLTESRLRGIAEDMRKV